MRKNILWAYVIGVALGDGNLSNPNGRAVRLRITCDAKYPRLAKNITASLTTLFPENSVAVVKSPTNTYFNISVYSNVLASWLPWKVGAGTKLYQKAHVPRWIKKDTRYVRACLRGLFQTDGSIYMDRGYLMVNFSNHTKPLALDVLRMVRGLGFEPTFSQTGAKKGYKYTVRVARQPEAFIKTIRLFKA